MRLNYIDNIDCLEGLKEIPDNSVDLVITDPPYGIMRGGGALKNTRYDEYDWDRAIPPEILMPEYARVLRPRGKLVMFAMEPLSAEYISHKYPLLNYAYKVYWKKNSPALTLGAKKNPVSYIEEILVFTRADNVPNADAEKLHPLREYFLAEREKTGLQPADFRSLLGSGMASHYFTQGEQFLIPTEDAYKKLQSTGHFPLPFTEVKKIDRDFKEQQREKREKILADYSEKYPTVFNLPTGAKSKSNVLEFAKDYPSLHPTQKPVKLVEDLILTYSNPGAVVLDTFMGSGTTAVACLRTGRNFIGFELDEKYHAIAMERIAAEAPAEVEAAEVAAAAEDEEDWLA